MKKIIVDFDDLAGGVSRIYKCEEYRISTDQDFLQMTKVKEVSAVNYTSGFNAEFESETVNELIHIRLSNIVQILVNDEA